MFVIEDFLKLNYGQMVEWFKAHAWKACDVNSIRRFESSSVRQLKLKLNTDLGLFFCYTAKMVKLKHFYVGKQS